MSDTVSREAWEQYIEVMARERARHRPWNTAAHVRRDADSPCMCGWQPSGFVSDVALTEREPWEHHVESEVLRAAVSHVPTQTCAECGGMGEVVSGTTSLRGIGGATITGHPCPAGCTDGRVPSGEKLMWGANTDACIVHGVDESAEPDQWVQWLDVRERERTVVLGFKVERLYRALKPSAEETT